MSIYRKTAVLGASGQLGSALRRTVHDLSVCSDASVHDGPEGKYRFFTSSEVDITDRASVLGMIEEFSPEVIVNCAAYTAVDRAEEDEEKAFMVNAVAVGLLGRICALYGIRLVHISTDYVFDGKKNTPYLESDAVAPLGVYGRSKMQGERLLEKSGAEYVIMRTSWLYSEYGSNFFRTMMRLTSERDLVRVVIDQVGTPTYACDLADCIVRYSEAMFGSGQRIFHFSNEGVSSWYDFAWEINRIFGNGCSVVPCMTCDYPSKTERPAYSVLDKRLISSVAGRSPRHWKDALNDCMAHYAAETIKLREDQSR